MGLIDSHTHLDSFLRRGALAETLQRAAERDVEAMITVGTDLDDWEVYRQLAADHAGVIYHTVGLHPCSVDANWEPAVAKLASFWEQHPRPVALGECGLDRFHLPRDDAAAAAQLFAAQRAAFARQLEIAGELACPVVVHSRGAFAECVEMIDASGVDWTRVVFHCFAEGPAEMTGLRERGGWGSFTGILTYKNAAGVRDAARVQGLDRLMLETDAPYLTPVPHRGKPNEPGYLRHAADYAAEFFAVSYEELARITSRNVKAFYGLG
jgi:TatD DNase family protein